MFKVRVPASTANLGPGFDCMGIALNLYNTADFERTDSGFEIKILDESSAYVPTNENNLLYKAMDAVYKKAGEVLDGIKITVKSDIPVTRGLGSSSSGIIMGLVGANHLLDDRFSKDELLHLATILEGHPDNVTPALLGGYTVSYAEREKVIYSRTDVSCNLRFAAMIPDFYLQTKRSRLALPKFVHMRNVTYNVAHASLLASAFFSGDEKLLYSCFRDKIHQRFRFPFIKSGEYITRCARRFGAYGSFISGAGPTIMSVISKDNADFEYNMRQLIKTNLKNWRLVMLEADNEGTVIQY
ncbi:MAG: homoserine kinase [Ruminococcaceae bacterium]|nr:homoserine kinase [Oscillospiraceae bacterium]